MPGDYADYRAEYAGIARCTSASELKRLSEYRSGYMLD